MEIKQRKNGHKLKFIFKDNILNYTYKYSGGSGDYDIPYADFPSKSITHIERSEWCGNIGWIWIFLGIGYNIYRIYTIHLLDNFGILSIILGILCLIWAFFRKIKFTIFETPKASILIIKNRKHNKIIDELQSRRKEQLLELYGSIDYDNNIENEIKKFEWLKDEEVLSDKEAKEKISEVKEGKKERIGFIQ